MEDKDNDFLVSEPIYVMTSEPGKNYTVNDLRNKLSKNPTEQTLADVYAVVCNKVAWLDDELYDNPGLKKSYEEWSKFEEELIIHIEEIIKTRKLPLTNSKKPCIHRGEQFMTIYGYIDDSGWWRKNEYRIHNPL